MSGIKQQFQPGANHRSTLGFVDLFSGAGGMSYGFFKHPAFQVLGAADAELAKPSMSAGSLQCNFTYEANMGIRPVRLDLSKVDPDELRGKLGIGNARVDVLSVCPPCTGFSRTNPLNHLRDDGRNNLVKRAAHFATSLNADVIVMENARELLQGNFAEHFAAFRAHLEGRGYKIEARIYVLTKFGLPQIRERAIVIAAKQHLTLRTLDDLWEGCRVAKSAVTVRAALTRIPARATAQDQFPMFAGETVAARLAAVPKDGGSWIDLTRHRQAESLMTDGMKKILAGGNLGSHPDIYGRMWWDRPAPTIKRECAHIGNGRYAHPEENRLCSVREMACLQGFPSEFQFAGAAMSNNYRHIGDAVPPLVSHQLAHVCHWILSGTRPRLTSSILKGTHLRSRDLQTDEEMCLAHAS